MALATFADLKTAIETWLERTGDTTISANANDLVDLAEQRINADFAGRLRTTKIDDATLTGTTSSREISISSLAFLAPHSLFLTTFGVQEKLRPFIPGHYELETSNSIPTAWAINGTNIVLDSPCDQAHTFIFRYYQQLNIASAVPWLFTNYPQVYLYAALTEAAVLTQDEGSFLFYDALYKQRRDEVRIVEAENVRNAPAVVDSALRGPGIYDINADSHRSIH